MEPPAVSLVLVLALGLTATLSTGHALVEAEGTSVPAEDTTTPSNTTSADKQCSPLQRRQDLLDNRLTERDTDLSSRLNCLNTRQDESDTRLNSRLNGVDARLNRMDGQFDDIETAISDMKEYLRQRLDAMEVKAEWALAGTKHKGEVGAQDSQPTTTPQSNSQPTTTPQRNSQPTTTPPLPKDCREAYTMGSTSSGIYTIEPEPNNQFDVYCEQELDGGGWVVFQLRKDGSVDFYRNWNEYKDGFGQLTSEFWLGNDKIHLLTKHHDTELKIRLMTPEDEVAFATYAHFWIEGPAQRFKLHVSGYSGGTTPGDSLTRHNGSKFSTKDENNHKLSCSEDHEGAWWYGRCDYSDLNGRYGNTRPWKGMNWYPWKSGNVSMKGTQMMLRKSR